LDVGLSTFAFSVLLPLLCLIAIWIKLDSKGPVFFIQKRVGIHKTYFQLYKFRTMKINTPDNMPTHMLENPDVYITKSGSFLRKTGLDELPQLIHIMNGDMSIVGPRPALWNQTDLIVQRDLYGANDVFPGLTGLAQVSGRDELSIFTKAKLDGRYVQKLSFLMDVYCVLETLCCVVKQRGYREGTEEEETKEREMEEEKMDEAHFNHG